MTVRAFACHAPHSGELLGYVDASRVQEWPAQTRIVRLRLGKDWRCALLDRSRLADVEGMLLREAVPSDEADCPDCGATSTRPGGPAEAAEPAPANTVQAAAIAMQGVKMLVVLVRLELVQNAGEAALVQGAFERRYGGVPIVLVGQDEDGAARYYGDAALVDLLSGLPLERMPWKAVPAP